MVGCITDERTSNAIITITALGFLLITGVTVTFLLPDAIESWWKIADTWRLRRRRKVV